MCAPATLQWGVHCASPTAPVQSCERRLAFVVPGTSGRHGGVLRHLFSSGRAPALLFHRVRGLSRDLLAGSTADQGSKLELRLEEGCAAGRVQSTPRAHGRNCRTTREAQATAARNLREARTRQGSLSRIQ